MKKVQKGFTLVELIVVITILAILATIAFISLQGYSQDARNSKVDADIRTLVTSIETSLTDGTLTSISSAGDNTLDGTNNIDDTTAGQLFGPADTGLISASGATYEVGLIDFVAIRQNGADFKDSSTAKNDYIVSTVVNGDEAYYQISGQTQNPDATFKAVTKGNYISSGNANNVAGLISDSTASTTPATASGSMVTGLY